MKPRAAGLLVALALSACGSTIQDASSGPSGGDGLASPPAAGDGTTTGLVAPRGPGGSTGGGTSGGSSTTTGGSSTTGLDGGSTVGGTGTSGASPSGPTPPISASTSSRGVTATTVTLGFAFTRNGEAANSAIGASGLSTGDDEKNAQAMVDEINATGGVAGRKVKLAKFAYDATSTQSAAAQDQRACSAFTQDAKVLAVIGGNLSDVLLACLDKAGIPLIKSSVIIAEDTVALRRYSGLILLGTFAQDRALADLVPSLVQGKWFTGWNNLTAKPGPAAVKVGVLSYDLPEFGRSVKGTLIPALKRAGYPVADSDVAYVHKPENQGDTSRAIPGIKSATLRFQQSGVTHLVINDASGLLMGLFASNARSQGYYPRFGLTSGSGTQAIHDNGLVSSQQLNGLAGNSWMPTLDLPAGAGDRYATPATRRCLEILKRRSGQTYTSTNAATIALGTCDQFFLVSQALRKAASLTALGLVQSIERLGGAYVSPTVPGARLAPGRHYGAGVAWDITWHADCECVRYSRQHSVP